MRIKLNSNKLFIKNDFKNIIFSVLLTTKRTIIVIELFIVLKNLHTKFDSRYLQDAYHVLFQSYIYEYSIFYYLEPSDHL